MNITERIESMNAMLRTDESFDLVYRTFIIGERTACLYFIDGFIKDELMEKILDFFCSIKPEDLSDAHHFLKKQLPYVEVDATTKTNVFVNAVLSGICGLLIDGFEDLILIDCRTYPARSVSEPEKNKSLRGSRDGFVETIVMNAALIRRRIRDPHLTISMTSAGTRSKTDIALCYMSDKVNPALLAEIKKRILSIQAEALTMNQESLAECLYQGKWINPLPKFKYSERPDATASAILEGHLVLLVDNSPSAMILPTNFFDLIEEADDYYFPPVTAAYLRLSRFIICLCTLFLTPVFLFFVNHPEYLPSSFSFITIENEVNISVFAQLLILEIAIDGMKLAAVNTPNMLNTPLSIIAGIILSDSAVQSGWFNEECLLYMAFAAFGTYTMASFEFGYALKFFRLILLCLTQFGGFIGLCAGTLLILFFLAGNKTIAGDGYLYPLWPLRPGALLHRMFRLQKR